MSTKKRLYYVETAGYDMVISVELEDDHHIFYATDCPSMEMPCLTDADSKEEEEEMAMQYLQAVEDDTSWDEDIQWDEDIDGKFDIDNFFDWFFNINDDNCNSPDRPKILAELDTEL